MDYGYVVEANFGTFFGEPIWYDLTPWVEFADGLTMSRGRQDEQSDPRPGTLRLVLDNADGRFTPGNTASPYWPYLVDGAPLRVTCRRAPGVNLLDNNSFELGVGDWTNGGVGTAPTHAQSTAHVYPDGGTWAMLVTWAATAPETDVQRRITGLTVGQTYTLSYYVYVPTGSPAVYLKSVTESGATTTTGSASAVNDAFTRVTVTFTAGSTTHLIQLATASSPGGGTVYADAGQLETGGSATTLETRPAVAFPRFYGFLSEAPVTWPVSGVYARAEWSAVDLLERVGSRAGSLRPMVLEEALLDSPLVLLPLDEADGATQAASLGSTQGVGTLYQVDSGTYQFAAGTGPPADGSSSLVLTRGGDTAGWFISTPAALASTDLTVETWVNANAPAPGVSVGTMIHLSNAATGGTTTPSAVLWHTSTQLVFHMDGPPYLSAIGSSIADGHTHHVAATCRKAGGTVTLRLYVDGAQVASASSAGSATTVTAAYMLVGGAKSYVMWSGTINHCAVYPTALSADRISAHYHAGWDGFGGETSDQRISRLASYARLASLTPTALVSVWKLDDASASVLDSATILAGSDLNLENGQAVVYGQAAGGSDYLTEIRAVTTTEGGLVYVDGAGQFRFHARDHRYNRPLGAVRAAEDADPGLYPAYDLQGVVNDVTVTGQANVTARYTDPASIAQRGIYAPSPIASLSRDPLDVWSMATWQVNGRSAPTPTYRQVTFDLATLPADAPAQLLALDVGDRLQLTGLPGQAADTAPDLIVEGWTETATPDQWRLTFNTSPAGRYDVWRLDDAAHSVLDSTTITAW